MSGATYSETTNSLSVAYNGNRLILNDLELQQQFPNVVDYPTLPAASQNNPLSIERMLGPSFVSGGQQVIEFVRMMAYNEVYLRCPQLANASRVLGNLGDDILSKITLKSGVGAIAEGVGGAFGYLGGLAEGAAALAPTAGRLLERWLPRRELAQRQRQGWPWDLQAAQPTAAAAQDVRSANNMNDATQPQHSRCAPAAAPQAAPQAAAPPPSLASKSRRRPITRPPGA